MTITNQQRSAAKKTSYVVTTLHLLKTSILTRESNDFKLKIMESLLIAPDKPILNKADSSLPLELFYCNISGYIITSYDDVHLSHCAYTIVSVFIMLRVLSKTKCKSTYYHFRRDHQSSSFRKLARNKSICRETCDFFRKG